MSGRAPIPGTQSVNILLYRDSYHAIKEYASISPAGLSAAHLIREVVHEFGKYCQAQLDAGRVATIGDGSKIRDIISRVTISPSTPND